MHVPRGKKRFSGLQVLAIVVGVMVVTVLATILVARSWFFPKPFTPVVLRPAETQQLDMKLTRFTRLSNRPLPATMASDRSVKTNEDLLPSGSLKPEAYSEAGASREINLNEREINSLLAKNTDLAKKMAIDLGDDLISARLLLPVDPDFPMFGGKTLRVRAGAELAYNNNRPVVKLRGISIMGVPIPNAWLGGLKNIDLVSEYGTDEGFWKTFADGVESIHVHEGVLQIKLKE